MPIQFAGHILPFYQRYLLVYGPDAGALGQPAFEPPVYLRPAYKLLAGPDYLLPEEAIDDVGRRIRAPQAYDWIETHGDLFPRADVIGLRPTGERESVFMKELDLADMALYAGQVPAGDGAAGGLVRLSLAIEALAVNDGVALAPVSAPPELEVFRRALPFYRLSPGIFGALGASILQQLLASGRRDWRLTFDQLDDFIEW